MFYGKREKKCFNSFFYFHKGSVKTFLKWFINNYDCGLPLTITFYIGSCEWVSSGQLLINHITLKAPVNMILYIKK